MKITQMKDLKKNDVVFLAYVSRGRSGVLWDCQFSDKGCTVIEHDEEKQILKMQAIGDDTVKEYHPDRNGYIEDLKCEIYGTREEAIKRIAELFGC